jgi:hypothetical protein
MRIGGWKTAAMFRRYDIVFTAELDEAIKALEAKNGTLTAPEGHEQTTNP